MMGCSDSDSDSKASGSDSSGKTSDLAGTKCDEKGAIKCKSPDTPSLAYKCSNGKWIEVDYSQVADKEADVCVVIDGKDQIESVCPSDSEGSHATLLPHFDPVCAVAECVKDSRGVLYTKEYSLVCENGGEVSGNTCVCEPGSDSGSDLAGTKCDEKGAIKCKSPDTPSLAYECSDGKWIEVDYSQVVDKEADVCVVIDGKDQIEPVCPSDSEGSHATLLSYIAPVCAVAECAKDSRGVLYTKEYSFSCEKGGKVSGNTCDCEAGDE